MKRSRPWYADAKEQIEISNVFLRARPRVSQRTDADKYEAEINNFQGFTLFRLVFESNRIEGAGLSEGETKRLVQELVKDNYSILEIKDKSKQSQKIRVKFGRYSREENEVVQHFNAIAEAFGFPREKLFSPDSVKELHRIMADGLIPKEWGGLSAGQYRNDAAHTNGETLYVAHQNIPAAMEKWADESKAIMNSEESPVLKAARISHRFVAIHPFPDFNGRLARIILNMVLWAHGLRFMVVIQGSSKEKHKYLTALRHANHGNLERYACLIARAVNEGFEQLNERLKLAGLEPITPAPKD